MAIFAVDSLDVSFGMRRHRMEVVRGVSFAVDAGKTLAIVGESGSGKSVSLLGATGLLPPSAAVAGSVRHRGTELLGLSAGRLRRLRGAQIGFVFQDPLSNLHPLKTIGSQIGEAITAHQRVRRSALRARILDLLDEVGIRDPARRLDDYPHQFSGGMRQRVMIAMAIALGPDLLIADEPTTALDVTVQAAILTLLRQLQERHGMALIFVSHDLGVVNDIADDVVVMRGGSVVEQGPAARIYGAPKEPYTRLLLGAARHGLALGTATPVETKPLLTAEGISRRFRRGGKAAGSLQALDQVSFALREGEILGVVGESGSGKSTIGRIVVGLDRPDEGQVRLGDNVYAHAGAMTLTGQQRSAIQMVFQDPYGSLNPRRRIGAILAEPFIINTDLSASQIRSRIRDLVDVVELPQDVLDRYPAQLSGGQRQRIAIARAVALEPRVIVADEPVSALDITTQARIIALLRSLRSRLGVSILFISHDLGVVADLCDRVLVLQAGRIVEEGPTAQVFQRPGQAYTRALIAAIPGQRNRDGDRLERLALHG
ncbi:ABC transporter ATP-binding protein [Labrys sp. WJW]|uniref:dipeptide ABC transporter ATP-binding protein n=1 Tax=Labrys sp. WJW TaxID=1737983 RepID=UPI00082D7519|nr:ABC transporter ATP-binding protein [Labrys sp. WJW]OCC03712.1 ABC transporter ATP-binding protein [Labrys sp. WJW]